MDANGARATVWMGDDRIRSYSDDHGHSPADRHPADYAAGVIAELSPEGATVGIEMDAAYYTARCHRRLTGRLPDASFVDATLLVGWTRLAKSDAERDLMREAARLSEDGGGRRDDRARRPGVAGRGGDLRGADRRDGRARRRLPRDRAADAVGRPHRDAAPDLERPRVRGGRPGDRRTRGLSPPLPRAAGPDSGRRRGSRRDAPRRGRRDRGARGRARRRRAGRHLRGGRAGLARDDRGPRDREGVAARLRDGAGLPARLGRAHRQHPAGRRDGAGAGHDVPRHPGDLDRRVRRRDQRVGSAAARRPPRAAISVSPATLVRETPSANPGRRGSSRPRRA